MRRSAPAVSIALLLFANAATADEVETRLLLLSNDRALAHAITSALSPWGVTVIRSDLTPLGSSMPVAARAAHDIAEREHVDGVAWISASDRGPALWTYDVHKDQAVSRSLTLQPPYDEATAASVALSLKTLLRSTEVAPPAQRIGGETVLRPVDNGAQAPLQRYRASEVNRRSNARASAWFVRTGGGVRFNASTAAQAEPRLAISFGRRISQFSIAVDGSFGPGVMAEGDQYSLRLGDTTVALATRAAIVETPHFSSGLAANIAAHVLALSGDVGIRRVPVSDTRFDLSLGGGVFALVRVLRPLALAWSIDVNAQTLRQQYFVANGLALDEHVVTVDMFLWLSLEL